MIPLCRGLAKLLIVDVALNRGQDNPQLIFESMNSTGKALSQADLVRNFILMGLEPEHQTRLYEDHWRPMEVAFGQQGYSEYFDSFMRHYLTVKTGEIPRTDEVYEAFKLHARSQSVAEKGVDRLVEDIHIYAEYYCAMALGKEAYAIHQSGKWYTNDNIDQMLMERHLNKKARRSTYKSHMKGPRKRTPEDDERFAQSFEKMVLMAQENED